GGVVGGRGVCGGVYGQYLVMFFPHLAIFGAASGQGAADRLGGWLTGRRWLTPVLMLLPLAAFYALAAGLDRPGSAPGMTMLAAFTGSAALAAWALWQRARGDGRRAAILAIAALTAMTVGNAARIFRPIGPQLDALAYVTTHTRPDDQILGSGVTGGAGAFRPNAWPYYFTPALATDAEVADLVARVTSGQLRPRLIAFDDSEG